jgi:hypothetical protein
LGCEEHNRIQRETEGGARGETQGGFHSKQKKKKIRTQQQQQQNIKHRNNQNKKTAVCIGTHASFPCSVTFGLSAKREGGR